jgi:hypothetical protein
MSLEQMSSEQMSLEHKSYFKISFNGFSIERIPSQVHLLFRTTPSHQTPAAPAAPSVPAAATTPTPTAPAAVQKSSENSANRSRNLFCTIFMNSR